MPAAAVIPAPEAYANVAAVKRLAVECRLIYAWMCRDVASLVLLDGEVLSWRSCFSGPCEPSLQVHLPWANDSISNQVGERVLSLLPSGC